VEWNLTEEGEAAELGLDRETYGVGEEFEFTSGLGNIPINLTETSIVNGLEFDLQTNLFFLPGLLKNFVINTNFTLIQSESQLFSSERVLDEDTWQMSTVTGLRSGPMPQQPNYIVNVTLGYDIGGFSGRISMFSQGRTLNGVGKLAPFDTYIDPFTRFDLSLKYSLNDHLTFLFNGTNIFNEPDAHYQSDTPKYRLLEYYGSMWDFGVQWTF
jgi:outer membrane receptor protein involved in Fe transport